MKNRLLLLLMICWMTAPLAGQSPNPKFTLWQTPSLLRGFNLMDLNELSLDEVKVVKDAGASFAYVSTHGIWEVEFPHALRPDRLQLLDSLVQHCRRLELYYAIAVREGPGRRDVFQESELGAAPSTIWTNAKEQAAYGAMLKSLAERYGGDEACIGLAPFVEPNPLFRQVHSSGALLKARLEQNGIDLPAIYEALIDSIRSVRPFLPVIVQNAGYSSPEYFDIMEEQRDEYVVYEFHSYRPKDYTSANEVNSVEYPGTYFSFIDQALKLHDKRYLDEGVFRYVHDFRRRTGKPILLGEFGLRQAQIGARRFLGDIGDIMLESGWHFALWEYSGDKGNRNYDYHLMGDGYWETIMSMFSKESTYQPPLESSLPEDRPVATQARLYPQPARDFCNLELEASGTGPIELRFFDLAGRLRLQRSGAVLTPGMFSMRLDIAALPGGFYRLDIRGAGIRSFAGVLVLP